MTSRDGPLLAAFMSFGMAVGLALGGLVAAEHRWLLLPMAIPPVMVGASMLWLWRRFP